MFLLNNYNLVGGYLVSLEFVTYYLFDSAFNLQNRNNNC